MGMRMFHWSPQDLYLLYNVDHPDWPNVPPPPNPAGFQAFIFACINETVKDMNQENDPKASNAGPRDGRRQV